MPREVFPFADDLVAIDEFLLDRDIALTKPDSILTTKRQQLCFADVAILWFDTAGALQARLSATAADGSVARVINYVCDQLGVDGVTYERDTVGMRHWVFNDAKLANGEVFTVAGPMTVQAYRATKSR